MTTSEQKFAVGFDMQFGTNHLGAFALTNFLLPQIIDRVVVVSSDMHRTGRVGLDDLNWDRGTYKPSGPTPNRRRPTSYPYGSSSVGLTAAGSPLRAVAAHPGYAATNLQRRTGSAVANPSGSMVNRLIAQSEDMEHAADPCGTSRNS